MSSGIVVWLQFGPKLSVHQGHLDILITKLQKQMPNLIQPPGQVGKRQVQLLWLKNISQLNYVCFICISIYSHNSGLLLIVSCWVISFFQWRLC